MLIRLQKYDVHMIYTQGKYMYTADTPSRAVDKKECADSEESAEIQAYVDMVVTSRPATEDRPEQFQRETIADETMKKLKNTILTGWPGNKKEKYKILSKYKTTGIVDMSSLWWMIS